MVDGRQPDFLLAGAMKAGSTTLDAILDQHPEISMAAEKDTGFLDREDTITHLEYALTQTDEWAELNLNDEEQWQDYLAMFPDDDTIKGEATASYMYSRKSPQVATEHLDDPNAVFILRDPVERAYSQYWHQVRHARTPYSFERSIKRDRNILDFSIYPPHLQRWENALGRDNIYILLLEELIDEPQQSMDSVFGFLGVDSIDIDLPAKNTGSYPRLPTIYRTFNLVLSILGKDTTTPALQDDEYWSLPEKAFRKVMLNYRKPSMNSDLRKRLQTIFRNENEGVTNYVGNVEQYWPTFSTDS